MDLQPGREGEVEAMVVVADGRKRGTLERGCHGGHLGFRRGEKERVEWKAKVTGGYEVEDVARAVEEWGRRSLAGLGLGEWRSAAGPGLGLRERRGWIWGTEGRAEWVRSEERRVGKECSW